PRFVDILFSENWSTGGIVYNSWTISGGTNWQISTTNGNPAPSMAFNSAPQVTNYDQYLTSKTIMGVHSPLLKLNYDIYLSNFGTTNLNTMAVELWDGTTWHVLKSYTNAGGNISWTSETIDITAYTHISFKIRFHSAGVDSYDINNWNIDNMKVVACDNPMNDPCVAGYGFYLNNTLAAIVHDTTYTISCDQVQYGQPYNACVDAIYASGNSSKICKTFTSHFLSLPSNVTATPVENTTYLQWTKPLCNGVVPPGLTGYNIYRSMGGTGGPWTMIKHLYPYPDSLSWYDTGLDPGKWCYRITGYYDLSLYGFPGQFNESLPTDAVCATLIYGAPLPSCEDWSSGAFVFNQWTFGTTGQGNWNIETGEGNPSPAADFSWQPIRNLYSYEMISKVYDASGWTCDTIWLDFDYQLVDRLMSGNEKLTVDVFFNYHWHNVMEYSNNGSVPWTSQHLDISGVNGKPFKVRFTASGNNSSDIFHWYVDNICVYGVGIGPDSFTAHLQGSNVMLNWDSPPCDTVPGSLAWFIFDDGSMENAWGINPATNGWIGNEFPLSSTISGVIKSVEVLFWTNPSAGSDQLTIDFFDGSHTLVGSTNQFHPPSNAWDSILVNDVPFSGTFYAMVHWNNTASQTNWLGYDENGPYASQDLENYYDGTTWSKLTTVAGANPGVCMIRIKAMVGSDKELVELSPGQKIVPNANASALTSHGPGSFDSGRHETLQVLHYDQSDNSILMGYNLYRTDGNTGTGTFVKRNTTLINGLDYTDPLPANVQLGDLFRYYVGALFYSNITNLPVFESSSDTIMVSVISGINDNDSGEISLFPNPTDDWVQISSTINIRSVEIRNLMGQPVDKENAVETKKLRMNVSTLETGIYFVKIITDKGTRVVKMTVTR
ncbi:MAG: T9SS type A sorting domain-containing protein, partial [Bacteroidota bacterium]